MASPERSRTMMIFPFLAVDTLGFWVLLALSSILVSSLIDEEHPYGATTVALVTLGLLAWLGNFNPVSLARQHPTAALLVIPAYLVVGIGWCYLKWTLFVGKSGRAADAGQRGFEQTIAGVQSDLDTGHEQLLGRYRSLHAQIASHCGPDVLEGVQEPVAPVSGDHALWNLYCRELTKSFGSLERRVDACQGQMGRGIREGFMREIGLMSETLRSLEAQRGQLVDDTWRRRAWTSAFHDAGAKTTAPMVRENKARVLAWLGYWPASVVWTMVNDPLRRTFLAIYESIGGSLQRISDRRFARYKNGYKTSAVGQ